MTYKRFILSLSVIWSSIGSAMLAGVIWWDLNLATDLGADALALTFFIGAMLSLLLFGDVVDEKERNA